MLRRVDSAPLDIRGVLRLVDAVVFVGLTGFLAFTINMTAMANIQSDAIDYYAITQRLVSAPGNPIVRNLHFAEQRSPGYPILSTIAFHGLALLAEPFAQTETITASDEPPQGPSETLLLPGRPLLFRELFFRNVIIPAQGSVYEWKLAGAMLITSYALLFLGLLAVALALRQDRRRVPGMCLAPVAVLASPVFMMNIMLTPAYATLAAFGLSGLFCAAVLAGARGRHSVVQVLVGLFGGLLVLTRFETAVIIGVVLVGLIVVRDWGFLGRFVMGGLPALGLLLVFNGTQFGNVLHLGLFRGDINTLALNPRYIVDTLLNPQSAISFWSPMVALGIAGLFVDRSRMARALGLASLALIAVILVRVPIMYTCVGEGTRVIGGMTITCPGTVTDALMLVRSDANRYVAVLIPFAVVGLRALIDLIPSAAGCLSVAVRRIRK